jgi:hypothetical protein
MGNENDSPKSSPNQRCNNNPKDPKQNYNTNLKKNKNNQLLIKKEKNNSIDPKSVINTIMTNIQQNSECDETEELDLDYLDDYIDTIFPCDFPKEHADLIRSQIYEIKNAKIGERNKIKNIFEFNQINNQSCFYFIMSMKKVTEKTANFAYKFKIMDISVKTVGIKLKEIIEKEENQDIIKKEYQKLNEKV